MKRKKKNKPKTRQQNDTANQPSDESDVQPPVPPPATVTADHKETAPQLDGMSLAKMFSFGLLLSVIILLGIMFYKVMAGFLVPMFLAALLVVIFEPFHQWFLAKCGGREALAAGLTTLSVLLAVLAPISALLVMAIAEGQHLARQYQSPRIGQSLIDLRQRLKLEMPSGNQFLQIESRFDSLLLQVEADEMTKQDLGLSEIFQNAAEIGQASELTWPPAKEKLADDNKPATKSQQISLAWRSFYEHLSAARGIDTHANWETGGEPLLSLLSSHRDPNSVGDEQWERQRHVDLRDYQQHLHQANAAFASFKVRLLGGPTMALVKQTVNPTDVELKSYADATLNFLKDFLPRIGGATSAFVGNLLLGTAIMIFSLYFFLLDGDKMIESIKGLSPLDDDHEAELIHEFGRISRAVVVATLLSALAQGLLAGIGFYFCGLESIFLLTLLSALLAMVPFVGAASVWLPCSLYLYFANDNLTAAIGLAIYGVAVISMADNVIKPLVLHGQSNLHPLLALLSVIGGVATLGPIGILVGPMVVVFLQTLLKILRRELDGIENGLAETDSITRLASE